ncbi:type VI secretion system-associated protein TagF [Luteimonas terrae]|uniref:Type VI secretion system protein ImpM n=1 Tax=Luteimonas terrae TaxID=1530191 RepID=A0ABU1XV57_9GAMM|nr:type VI secretion system-associated protein TagF [Luteimonas terrae]MDR7192625.1 type VI secretion system protein ImpM [Luteimonas terrae]
MSQRLSVPVGYFGKVPSRGDFVRSTDSHQLMALVDRWAAHTIELLVRHPDWKRLYDSSGEIRYAFLGSRSRTVIGGLFLPSRDQSQRRFPFLSAVKLEVVDPLGFIGRSALALSRPWAGLARASRDVVAAEDAAEALRGLADARVEIDVDPAAHAPAFDDFLELQTVGNLQEALRDADQPGTALRQVLPALGLLLQPILVGGGVSVDKGLELPLPRDPLHRPLTAAFWLDLIAAFLARGDFELAVLIRDTPRPSLIVGFNGADDQTLLAAFDPQVADAYLIRMHDAAWVEEQLASDYALNRLASYLDREDLSLSTARKVFRETFLGAV